MATPGTRIRKCVLLAAFGLVALAGAGRAAENYEREFRRGLIAYEAYEYGEALKIWRVIAENDEPRAQASLGFLYYQGLGVPQDLEKAAYWAARAAQHRQPEGQAMLGRLYVLGRGVPQDLVLGFAWCELAVDNGANGAGGCRSIALDGMHSHDEMMKAFQKTVELRKLYGPN